MQILQSEATVNDAYVPAEQLAQREAPAAEYFPVGQLVQRSVSPGACVAHVAVLHQFGPKYTELHRQLAAALLALVENEA